MIVLKALAATAALLALGLWLTVGKATTSTEAGRVPTAGLVHIVPQLTSPSRGPALSEGTALAIARQLYGPALTHPYTVSFGAYDFNDMAYHTTTGLHPVGRRDVWLIKITGLEIGNFCAPQAARLHACPPPWTRFAIFVDDQTGKVIIAQSF